MSARVTCSPQTCEQLAQSAPSMVNVLVMFVVIAATGHAAYRWWR